MTIIVEIIPYRKGYYIGEDIKEWLNENIGWRNYYILPNSRKIMFNSGVHPTQYEFDNVIDAMAFKLRWMK